MGIRFYYYDMFSLISKGHYLVRLNDKEPFFYYLDEYPYANSLSQTFIDNGWVEVKRTENSRTFYILSKLGWSVYAEGRNWFTSLPLYYKILGRLFV